jgi:hypothetical protein
MQQGIVQFGHRSYNLIGVTRSFIKPGVSLVEWQNRLR